MKIEIYDLAGHSIFAEWRAVVAGKHAFSWRGIDNQGHTVAPGIYMLVVRLAGDAGEQIQRYTVAVAY